ncbi:MAG: crossover junction endodeoxyribonuclease RuvC [Candidatus Shapirobacteria bacterium]
MILGIDPGLANTGWAVLKSITDSENQNGSEFELVECGCLETKISDSLASRLDQIYCGLEGLIKKYKVEAIAFETLYFAKNVKSASKVSEAIGVIKICGQRNGIEVVGFNPLQVKMALVGYGRADKDQVESMVRNILCLESCISPSHASDAVAIALTYLFTNKDLIF